MAVILQPYSQSNFESLYEIDQACYPRGIAYSRGTLRKFLTLPGSSCLLARASGEPQSPIAGFIIAESAGSEGRIITIDVLEAFRRTGIGSALLLAIEERLAAQGANRVELETATANAAGVAFWERHGYRKLGILHGYYLGRLDAWEMCKTLAPVVASHIHKT